MKTIQNTFKKNLIQLTRLSEKVNKEGAQKILEMINHHSKEIEELYRNRNNHWAIETGDLIILCYQLLLMENKNIDEILTTCIPRFFSKLKTRLGEQENSG